MEFVQEITLELNSNNAYTTVGAKQGDISSRLLKIHITENGADWTIPSGVSASYRVRKPDGYAVWNSAVINSVENTIEFRLTEQTLSTAGRAYADIMLMQGEGDNLQVLSTASFIIIIMASPDIVSNIVSTNEFSDIVDLTNNAKTVMNEAEAWAVGTKSGEPIIEPSFSYEVRQGSFTCSINEATFRTYVGESPGYTRYFVFTCLGANEGESTVHWAVTYGGITLSDINLSDYGITITGIAFQSDVIRVIVTDADKQYHNNAKYYADMAAGVAELGASAEKVYAEEFDATKNYNVDDAVWYSGELYTFKTNHTAGAWNSAEVNEEFLVDKSFDGSAVHLHFKLPQGEPGPYGFDIDDIKANATGNAGQPSAMASIIDNKLHFAFNIPPAQGTGAVSVDNVPVDGDRNIKLYAVTYSADNALATESAAIARANISAQIAGNYLNTDDGILENDLNIKSNNLTIADGAPLVDTDSYLINFVDSNNVTLGRLKTTLDTTYNEILTVGAVRTVNDNVVTNDIALAIDSDGNSFINVSNPSAWRSALDVVAGDTTPVADSSIGLAGISNNYARMDHSHPLNVASSISEEITRADASVAALGTLFTYARTDHVHPLNVGEEGYINSLADGATASLGSAYTYARTDHVHPLNVVDSSPLMDSATPTWGDATTYARSNHVHPIDTSRAEKAAFKAFTLQLNTTGWASNKSTLTDSNNIFANGYAYLVAPNSQSFQAYNNAEIRVANIDVDGKMTFYCTTVPTTGITLNIVRVVSS